MGKILFWTQAALLLLPGTLAVAALVFLDYPAWPQRHYSAPQAAFDVSLLFVVLGLVAAWRLVAGQGEGHSLWLALVVLGALPGLAGLVVLASRWIVGGEPGVAVGFALLAPAAVLAPLAVQLWFFR